MTLPIVFPRERIIEAGLEIIREKGWRAVTVRALAKKLGSSTMPIYSQAGSIENILKDLRERTREVLMEYQTRSYTEDPLLSMAIGYVIFARDEKNLFRFLYLEMDSNFGSEEEGNTASPEGDQGILSGMRDSFLKDFGRDSDRGRRISGLLPEVQEGLIQKSWIFTHGLAMIVNTGILGPLPVSKIKDLLSEAGGAFYIWENNKQYNKEEDNSNAE